VKEALQGLETDRLDEKQGHLHVLLGPKAVGRGPGLDPGLERGGQELEVQHFYRAIDFLIEATYEHPERLDVQPMDFLESRRLRE
jgi:hypothetical protein